MRQQRLRLVELAQLLINRPQRLIKFGLNGRLRLKTLGLLHSAVEKCDHAEVIGWARGFIATLPEVEITNAQGRFTITPAVALE